jgi:hypothetical protein
MLADIILIVLLTSFTTSSCSQTEETSKPRQKPPPLHIPRNTNPSIFTFSPSSTSNYSPSPAPFTPSFLNSLTDPHNSTPRSPNQATSRPQLSQPQTTPSISRRQRSVTSASSNSRQCIFLLQTQQVQLIVSRIRSAIDFQLRLLSPKVSTVSQQWISNLNRHKYKCSCLTLGWKSIIWKNLQMVSINQHILSFNIIRECVGNGLVQWIAAKS